MFSKKFFVALAVLSLLGIMTYGMIGSGAWFTDSANSNIHSISAGTLSIEDGKVAQTPSIDIPNMAPGDVTGEYVFIIKNNGNIPLAWFGNLLVGSSVLRDVIYIDYAKMEFLYPDGVSYWYQPDEFIVNGNFPGAGTTGLAGADGLISLAEWDGNNGMGVTPYEYMGYTEQDFSYRLTLRFGFKESAGNEYMAAGPLTIQLKVDATQVKLGALDMLGVGNALAWLNNSNCQYDGTNGTPAAISPACH